MNNADRSALIVTPVVVIIGLLMAFAGSQDGSTIAGIPVFGLLIGIAFLIQWLVFIPSYLFHTERFFDLTGSVTYLTVTSLAVVLSSYRDGRSMLLAALVIIWALRLGVFLYRRIQRSGKDDRFDEIKTSFFRFLSVWTLQGLWVTLTAAAALVAITTQIRKPLDWFALIGALIWLFGFTIEVVADTQKSRFRADPKNKGKFIQTGLWSRSRHPNYFGEIVLWIGIAVIALPVLQGWQWVALISPVFVAVLLTRVSGIPLLEDKADEMWGGQSDYEAYKQKTPKLIPRL